MLVLCVLAHKNLGKHGQTQDLAIPRNSAVTPRSSYTKIDDSGSNVRTPKIEISMSFLSSDALDHSSDGFAVVGRVDDKPSVKDDQEHPTVVRSEVGQVGVDATSRVYSPALTKRAASSTAAGF